MPDTANQPTSKRRHATSSVSSRLLTTLGLVGAFAVICMCSVRIYGLVIGEEFSPDTFKQRKFYYFELPLVHLQVTPVWRDEDTSTLAVHLRSKKLLPASKEDEPRWHFVHAIRGGEPLTGDANILRGYMEIRQDDEILWLQWSKDHREAAAVFWPTVAEVARDHQYVFLPEMFELALAAENADGLRRDLDQLLAKEYSALAANQFALAAHSDAIDSYTQALRYLPGDAAALKGRADAYEADGKPKLAAKDRQKARELTE
jgi:hypothetical protein